MARQPHRSWIAPALSAILPLFPCSCSHDVRQDHPARAAVSEGDSAPASFLDNVEAVRSTRAYRQNCWMIPRNGKDDSSSAALCIDLNNEVHLVVFSNRSPKKLSGKMQGYQVSISRLRASMHPDSSLLDGKNAPIAGIFRVPEDCTETFGADAINSLLGSSWKPGDFGFQYD